MAEIKLGVIGAGGRMGCSVIRQISKTDGCRLLGACDLPGSKVLGRDAGEFAGVGELGVAIQDKPEVFINHIDAVIEFSSPEATVKNSGLSAEAGCAHVIGTTGLTRDQELSMGQAAHSIPIIYAPNMSLAVNILFALTRQVSSILGDEFDIEVLEMHHRNKVDAPSGTALGLGRAAAEGRNVSLDENAVFTRSGLTGPRRQGDIGFATLRGGSVTGDHAVIFAADGERLELFHRAENRQIFARGAVRAAMWSDGKGPGLYSMADVLGLNSS
jgi:4-hydroxy-tetrahydrodipicolinate reductase